MKLKNRAKWVVPLFAAFTIPFSTMGTAVMAGSIEPNSQAVAEEAAPAGQISAVEAETGTVCPSYQEAYDKMTALKEQYPEGTPWTNFTPYGRDGKESSYIWKGGAVKGSNQGVGCAAFVFILSDEAFGNLPARAVDRGNFTFEEIKTGDILRTNGGSHFVIVLQKSTAGVVAAEGNYNKSVHWGRAISKDEVMDSDFIITRYPANFVPPDDTEAGTVVTSGTEGSLSWTLTKAGTLTISGNGDIPDYSMDGGSRPSWDEHNDVISTIVLSDGVTKIGDYAFYQSKALTVYIPGSVQTIGKSAFHKSALINVTIPGTVETIGDNAFYDASNLVSATVAEGVKTIGNEAFRGCTALTYIDFPASITSVGAGAFMSCKDMKSVRFMPGSEAVTIGDNVFSQCWNLVSVTLPQAADRISAGMFQSCASLPTLYIPKSVTEIGEHPFTSCNFLKTISFGGSEKEWNNMLTPSLKASLMSTGTTVICDVEFNDPFAKDPDDPGDFTPVDPDPEQPAQHEHSWSEEWSSNGDYHWHQCEAADCPLTEDSQKDGYGEHSYSDWVIDVEAAASREGSKHRDCSICKYRQDASIPASGNQGDTPGGSGKPNGTGGTNKPSSPNSSKNLSTAKKQLKVQLAAKLKKQVKPQLGKQLKQQLKKPLSGKGKAKLKTKLRTKLRKQLKARLKPQFKKKFGKKMGSQFSKTFDAQFNAQFNSQFNKQFNAQYKRLSKAKRTKK